MIRPTGGSTEQVSVALKLVQVAAEIVMSEKDWCWNFDGFPLLYVQLNDDGRRNGESQMNGRIRIRGVPSERCDAHQNAKHSSSIVVVQQWQASRSFVMQLN